MHNLKRFCRTALFVSLSLSAMNFLPSFAVEEADAKFIKSMDQMERTEIAITDIAKDRCATEEARGLAKHVQLMHVSASNKLEKIAERLGITLEPKLNKDHKLFEMKFLRVKAGKGFDEEFVEQMVADHKHMVYELTKAGAADAELRDWCLATSSKAKVIQSEAAQLTAI